MQIASCCTEPTNLKSEIFSLATESLFSFKQELIDLLTEASSELNITEYLLQIGQVRN